MKHFLTLMLLLSLLVPIGLASADDPAIGSKEDNACNAGGTMEGKCDTPWAWVCGYYLARWISNGGWNTPNNPFNNACVSLLPPRPPSPQSAVITICKRNNGGADTYCFSSDQKGTIDLLSNGTIDLLYFFTNAPVGNPPLCPATFGGKSYNTHALTNVLLPLYTADELFTILGLGVNFCIYF